MSSEIEAVSEEREEDDEDEIGCPHCGLSVALNAQGRLVDMGSGGELHQCSGLRGAHMDHDPFANYIESTEEAAEREDNTNVDFIDYE